MVDLLEYSLHWLGCGVETRKTRTCLSGVGFPHLPGQAPASAAAGSSPPVPRCRVPSLSVFAPLPSTRGLAVAVRRHRLRLSTRWRPENGCSLALAGLRAKQGQWVALDVTSGCVLLAGVDSRLQCSEKTLDRDWGPEPKFLAGRALVAVVAAVVAVLVLLVLVLLVLKKMICGHCFGSKVGTDVAPHA